MFNGDSDLVWEDGQVLEMDAGDGYTAVWVCFLPLNFPLKNKETSGGTKVTCGRPRPRGHAFPAATPRVSVPYRCCNNHGELSNLKQRQSLFLQTGGQNPAASRGRFLLEAPGEGLLPAFSRFGRPLLHLRSQQHHLCLPASLTACP